MSLSSAITFQPERDQDSIADLVSACNHVTLPENRAQKVILTLDSEFPLSFQQIGRLLLINGKYRYNKTYILLRCSPTIENQLHELHIDRLIWVESLPADTRGASA